MHPDATAKSYDPQVLFDDTPQLRKIGSRSYRQALAKVAQTSRIQKLRNANSDQVDCRLVFVQSSVEGFKTFLQRLNRPETRIPKGVQEEIRRVERFDLLSPEERVVGFDAVWKSGRVELVFHPSRVDAQTQLSFMDALFDEAGVSKDGRQVRGYPTGPTFVSCALTARALAAIKDVNPLRSVHPMVFNGLPNIRSLQTAPAPKPPASSTRSTIKVGMFDGGVDLSVPHLKGHVEEDAALSITTSTTADGIAHGTAVAGALLYGELNPFPTDARLPAPLISVVSFRALPPSRPHDLDLYESIDVIEQAVPARKDIKVFNISFGPKGPISGDTISRFTYVIDALAVAHKVAFVVAVGNDGDVAGYDRIQSPSDAVHSLGVGAFTLASGIEVRASYSCKGPGRECGKIKPDIAAFGGCSNAPFHVLSCRHGSKLLVWGTSFASPIVSRVCAQAAEAFDRSSPLLARALLVHGARHPAGAPDNTLGHGCVPIDVIDMLTCDAKSVTVVFQGEIVPNSCVRLPIPWPDLQPSVGRVQVQWTVAGLPPVDPRHPSDYTSGCLEDTFYPNERRYVFTNQTNKKQKKTLDIESDQVEATRLIAQGWKKSALPDSDSGNKYKNEVDRRAIDCKWEPVVRREIGKMASGLWKPFLTLQCIGRNIVPDRFDYAVVVTVSVRNYHGDLYTDIRTKFPALAPIRVRTEAEIRVQI
jgi:hypothetical protein